MNAVLLLLTLLAQIQLLLDMPTKLLQQVSDVCLSHILILYHLPHLWITQLKRIRLAQSCLQETIEDLHLQRKSLII